jgi:coenzyme F420-0:L-glutamate ligase/coenzyme F420-1:gamma-L-glutamate ligase
LRGSEVSIISVNGIPEIVEGDDIAELIGDALAVAGARIAPFDIVVVASTIVSKAEGRYFALADIEPSARARELGAVTGKDPRLVEVVLRESVAVSRARPNVLVVRHRLGFISANAGVDFSNVGWEAETGLLLPRDPDASAAAIRSRLESAWAVSPIAVIISDTHGRAFRRGNVNVAIGVSGVPPIVDERGKPDLFGRILEATVVPLADQVASAAALVSGEAAEGIPVVIVRGVEYAASDAPASDLNFPPELDLYA